MSIPHQPDSQEPNSVIPERNEVATQTHVFPASARTQSWTEGTTTSFTGSYVGRFQLLGRLGEGAFGDVFRAYDALLDRDVALKVAKPGSLASRDRLLRFFREAKAAANLRHPNIVPLYETGSDGERHYIASALIPGGTFQEELKQTAGPLANDRTVAMIRAIAEAMAYAHRQGIVHRDLKPGNILLDEQREPLIADFGLAVRLESNDRLTYEGAIMGTPAYMSPEQSAGLTGEIGPASDQYSLGIILYECLTGTRPFHGDMAALLAAHINDVPRRPTAIHSAVPRDLETICLKCLQKRPQDRYPSCADLAEDLRRWQAGESILARRPSWAERLWLWSRRNPVIAALTMTVFLVLLSGVIVSTYFARVASRKEADTRTALALAADRAIAAQEAATEAEKQTALAVERQNEAMQQKTLAEQNEREARWNERLATVRAHALQVDAMLRAREVSDWKRMQQLLEASRGNYGDSFENRFLQATWARYNVPQTTLLGHTVTVQQLAFSPDGQWLASVGWELRRPGEVMVWDAVAGVEKYKLRGHTGSVYAVAFSPDGQRLVTVGGSDGGANPASGEVILWDLEKGTLRLNLKGHTKLVTSVAFHPDGKQFATCGGDQTVRIWDAVKGAEIRTIQHAALVRQVAYSPDGKHLLTCSLDGSLREWDAEKGEAKRILVPPSTHGVQCFAYRPDGQRIVTISASPPTTRALMVIRDTASGVPLSSLPISNQLTIFSPYVMYSPDGKRILTSSSNGGSACLWDADRGTSLLIYRDGSRADASTFHPNGKRIAIARTRGEPVGFKQHHEIVFYDAEIPLGQSLVGVMQEVHCLAIRPDGKQLVTGGGDTRGKAELKVWDAERGTVLRTLEGETAVVLAVAYSPDGKRIVSASGGTSNRPGSVKIWDATTGAILQTLAGASVYSTTLAYSADGQTIATGGGFSIGKTSRIRGEVQLWDAATGKLKLTIGGFPASVRCLAFSPDGKTLIASSDGEAKLWDAQSGALLRVYKGHTDTILSASFRKDGKRFATGSQDGTVRVWDAQRNWCYHVLYGHSFPVNSVAFHPDNKRLVSGAGTIGKDDQPIPGEVKVWDIESGIEVLALPGQAARVMAVAFSPDGTWLASAGGHDRSNGFVNVWMARSRSVLPDRLLAPQPLSSVAYHRDGERIMTVGGERGKPTAQLWNANSGTIVLDLKGHDNLITNGAISPDGSQIATVGWDHPARIWDGQTGKQLHVLRDHQTAVWAVDFSPDGKRLVTGGDDKIARIWNVESGQVLRVLSGHGGIVYAARFSPDGQRIVTASDDKTARIWDVETGKERQVLKGHTAFLTSVAWSPDGQRIVTGSWDGTAMLWNADKGVAVGTLKGHSGGIRAVAWSPDGQRIVTGAFDKTLRVWDPANGREVNVLTGHTAPVVGVAFHPAGSQLVSVSLDRTARLWYTWNNKSPRK